MAKKKSPYRGVSLSYAYKEIIYPRRGMLLLGLLLVVVNRAASLALPIAPQYLFDEVILEKAGGGLDLDMSKLQVLIMALGAAVAIQALTSFSLTRLLSVAGQYLIAELRSKVQKHVLHLPTSYFDNTKSGDLVSRIMTDVEGVRNLVGTGFTQLIGGVLSAIVAFGILIYWSPFLTLISLVPLAIFGIISARAFGRIRPIFRDRGKIQAEVTGRLTESMGGIRVIKGFHAEDAEISIFKKGVIRLFENVKSSLTTTAAVQALGGGVAGVLSMLIFWFGSQEVVNGPMTDGQLISFVSMLAFLAAPILQLGNIGSQLTESLAGLDRTRELLDTPKETDDPDRTIEIGEIKGDFIFNDVHFSYEDEKEVIHGVSFDAPAGSVTALVGSSGSGKTTLAGLAATFLKPDSGLITVDGHDLSKVTLDSFRGQLGVVLQDDFLFEGSIRENILFSNSSANEEDLQNAVKAAYVNEFTDKFEEGLDTLIGERGVKLSGGQRQRIAIARAILANPKVLILDEATSNLDTISETFIQKSLDELMKDRTTFVIAHRLSTIRKADQILVIDEGNILEQGTHDELIAKEAKYYQLYTYQSRI
ncbi:MAG: ABC transporter ATP-binding protein/permease [Bacteroidia bacterium]|nr:ABC transporter ATP-binding protein/permease [Bacteroidia bacterium]